jgi:hypothetical protein
LELEDEYRRVYAILQDKITNFDTYIYELGRLDAADGLLNLEKFVSPLALKRIIY